MVEVTDGGGGIVDGVGGGIVVVVTDGDGITYVVGCCK